jgi:glyoxylase-like metal-dependent hydrolase (beta-lactamase superfamily II)
MIVDDPVYLDEPFIQSTTSELNPGLHVPLEPCTSSFDENGGSDPHFVPHYLPGQNAFLTEWLETQSWIPKEAARGGANTIYPPYTVGSAKLSAPLSRSAVSMDKRVFAQSPKDGQVHVLPVQRNVYMLIADGNNIAVSVGPDGALMVDTGPAHMSDKVLATIQELTKSVAAAPRPNTCMGVSCPGMPYGWASVFMNSVIGSPSPARPLRFIFNTSASPDRTGGNQKLAAAGFNPRGGADDAMRIAHEKVMMRMSGASGEKPAPEGAWPSDTYHRSFYKLSEYFNGEPVVAYHMPAAHSDGDSVVYFRHSEVISAGNVFSTVTYPVFDLQKGGSIQGVIAALGTILDLGVAESRSQGGTYVIPGRGRLSDMADVATYRNMVVMIRDRVQDLIKKGMTLEQVKAAQPTIDFDGRYGLDPAWTPAMFIEAVYNSLKKL